jgi:hypothetical protein
MTDPSPHVGSADASRRSEEWTLERLAELNRYDIIGKMLDKYRVALDLDDYDDEHANRFRDAALIARELSRMFGVPLSYQSKLDEPRGLSAGEPPCGAAVNPNKASE